MSGEATRADDCTTSRHGGSGALKPRFHGLRAPLLSLSLLTATTLAVSAPLSPAHGQSSGLPTLWPQGLAGRGARSTKAGPSSYLAMVGKATARSERRRQGVISLVCPAGTKRRLRMLPREHTDRVVGVEQAYREVHCRRPDGTLHGPVVQLRRHLRVRASTLMLRASLASRNVLRFGEVREGKAHGPWVQLDRTGRELGRMVLADGTGTWRVWHNTGALAINGTLKSGVREGIWRFFFRSGLPALTGAYIRDQKQGTWRWFYNNGEPMRAESFLGGQRHGLYTDWWVTGNKRKEGEYKRGLRDGAWLRWSEDGRLLGVHHLREGSGRWAEWHADGTLREAGPLKDDKRHGLWRMWDESGALRREGRYTNHVRLAGSWRFFNALGEPRQRATRGGAYGHRAGVLSRLTRPGGRVAGVAGLLGRSGSGRHALAGRGHGGLSGFSRGGSGGSARPHHSVGAGRVRRVTIAWVSKARGVKLDSRQAQILRVLVKACAQRFSIKRTGAGVRPRRGGKAMVSSVLRWKAHVRANGSVQRVSRTSTPKTLADRGGLRCADYVVARARFAPRPNQPTYTVILSATLIH